MGDQQEEKNEGSPFRNLETEIEALEEGLNRRREMHWLPISFTIPQSHSGCISPPFNQNPECFGALPCLLAAVTLLRRFVSCSRFR
jgi:hypothetical protein